MKSFYSILALVFIAITSIAQRDTTLIPDTVRTEVNELYDSAIKLNESSKELKTKVDKLSKKTMTNSRSYNSPAYGGSSGVGSGNNVKVGRVQANSTFSQQNGQFISGNKYNQQNNPAYQNQSDKNGTTISVLAGDQGLDEDFSVGQLTAGELSDFDKWELWQHIAEADFELYSRLWEINPTLRYPVQLMNGEGRPIVDAKVELRTREDKLIWTAKTSNTGSAELWGNGEEGQRIITYVDGKSRTHKNPLLFEEGINRFTIQTECNLSNKVDIAFIVDATGSMKDEIKYLQVEMEEIIGTVSANHPKLDFRTASVFYRCTGNKYSTRHANFSQDPTSIGNFIREQSAEEGGAELVDSALYAAVDLLNWSEEARARIAFLILDEPPGKDSLTRANMKKYITKAAEKGIRIVPVVASANYGTEESLEYLMRTAALLTNSSYVFLTDDSGIGNPHAKPSVDEYEVEKLNALMVRLINEFTYSPECGEDIAENIIPDTLVVKEVINTVVVDSALWFFQDSIRNIVPDTMFAEQPDTLVNDPWEFPDIPVVEKLEIWPNPTMGNLTVKVTGDADEVYLADISGKIIARFDLNENGIAKFDISGNPVGMYLIQCKSKNKWLSGKVVLMR